MGMFCSKLCQTEEDFVYVPYYDNGQVGACNEGENEGAMAYQSRGGGSPQGPPVTHLQPNMQPMFGNTGSQQLTMMPQQMQVVQQAAPAPQQQQGIPVKPIKPVPIMGIPVPRPVQAAVTPGQQQQKNPEPQQQLADTVVVGSGGAIGGHQSYGSSMSSSYPTSYQPACMECLGGGSRGSSY